MPQLHLDLSAFGQGRHTLAALRERERQARHALQQAEARLDALRRGGAADVGLDRAQQAVEQARAQARGLLAEQRDTLKQLRHLGDELRGLRDPAVLLQSLSAAQPVALLPVNLQTRYDREMTRLMLRIYPDALHAVQHDPGLTDAEWQAVQAYWTQRFDAPDDAAAAWAPLARRHGPMRAAWLVRRVQPTNLAQLGGPRPLAPTFDAAAVPRSAPGATQQVAAALPERFVVVGWQGGREVLRMWGLPVADELPLSPAFDPLAHDAAAAAAPDAAWDPFADERAWLVDYPAAEAAGMAITVTAQDLAAGARLADGFDRLVVLGVDWTLSAQQAGERLADLLHHQAHGQGLAFMPQGTPTNNTGSARAGHAADASDVLAALDPVAADAALQAATTAAAVAADGQPGLAVGREAGVAPELDGAGARLHHLLGLPQAADPAAGLDARVLPGGTLREGATSAHMINALWRATLGGTLRDFWNPAGEGEGTPRLIDDATLARLRVHAVRHLRPGGPLSVLRVGDQPYGILPVCARGYVPQAGSALERGLHDVLETLRGFWQAAVPRVPRLQAASAEDLHPLLAMQPWSVAKRHVPVAGPAQVANDPQLQELARSQSLLSGLVVAALLRHWPQAMPLIAQCVVRPVSHPLDAVAWVQRDPADGRRELPPQAMLAPDYIGALLQRLGEGRTGLRAALQQHIRTSHSLLEALLLCAADHELLDSGLSLLADHLTQVARLPAGVAEAVRASRVAEYIGVDPVTSVGDQITLSHAGAVLGLQLHGTTGDRSVGDALAAQLGRDRTTWPAALANIATFQQSLRHLQGCRAGELDHALRTTLDVAAWRLDAWITSLATRRLDALRERTPQGLHLGAWGVLEDLRPDGADPADRAADSLGHLHAPSLRQATTAAVLRSGHLANREQAGGAFELDLRSHRVQAAQALLEGVAGGQSLAALLGYRFEQTLRERGLAQWVLEFRQRWPLRPADGADTAAAAAEAIAARDVVDALAMLQAVRTDAATALTLPGLGAAERGTIRGVLDDLADLFDAVSDLLLAESVHQLVGGDPEASAAALATLDQQQRPPEPRIVRTPRADRGYTQRVAVVLGDDDAGPWADLDDLAARVEPGLNAWLARQLGDPDRFLFSARLIERVPLAQPYDGRPQWRWQPRDERLQLPVSALGLSPLSLVLGAEPQTQGGQSALQERLAVCLSARARERFGAAADAMAIVLDGEPPADAPAGSRGLLSLESQCWLLHRLLAQARALHRQDLVLVRDDVEAAARQRDGEQAGADVGELRGRVALAEAAADQALAALDAAQAALPADEDLLAALDPRAAGTRALHVAVRTALDQAAALGWRSATATRAGGDAQAAGARIDATDGGVAADPQAAAGGPGADTLPAAAARARTLAAEIRARLAEAPWPAADAPVAVQVRALVARTRAILGRDFPLLPRFVLGDAAAEVDAALARRATLLDGDDWAIAGWLPQLACVHEPLSRLSDALCAAEAQGIEPLATDFKLIQMGAPGRAPVRRWGALPPADGDDLRGVLAVVAHAPAALDGVGEQTRLSGLFIDEWSETLPAAEQTTGLSFHFDAPGARAPQTLLLAVPADPKAEHWTLDELLAVVDESLALARLRAVRPQDLQGLGTLLPALMLPQNLPADVPSVDLAGLLGRNLQQLRGAWGQHSPLSAMTMAAGKLVATE